MTPAEKISKARVGLILSQPFFASLALRMAVIEDAKHDTMATDGVALYFNPAWVDGLELPQLTGVIAHEIMHCALSHQTRRGARDPATWNKAADYAVNPIVRDAGFTLPDDALFDARFDGKSVDEIYRILDGERPQGGGGGQQPQPGQGSPDPGGCGSVMDAPPGPGNPAPSPADLTAAEREWKIAVTQAAQAAKAQGKLSGDLERLVEAVKQPVVDWRELLRHFMQAIRPSDYRWTPPNRRYISLGLFLPSLHAESLGDVVVAVDTSGSIDDETLALFSGEISSILEETRPERVHVIYCDRSINRTQEFIPDDLPIRLEAVGGGGTDFRPPFAWVEEQGIDPACFIYLTDLCSSRFPEEPPYPVLWASTSDRRSAPFGDVIQINPS